MEKKKIIYAFPQPKWIDKISCDGKPCGGGSSCGSETTSNGNCKSESCGDTSSCDFSKMLEWFAVKNRNKVKVKIADFSSPIGIKKSLKKLNKILRKNKENLRVTFDNFELVFSQIAPIIAINNVLAYVGKAPGENDLLELIQ